MDIEINEDILKKTTECEKNFGCLSSKTRDFCEVDYCTGNGVLFVKSKFEKYCPYKMSFGYKFICRCPVRNEIYRRYKI